MTGLYIHIPFCSSRCRYCDFYRMTPGEWHDDARFLTCLDIELSRLPSGFAPDTVFIGGGTPSILSAENYACMLESVRHRINLSHVCEFTTEANPGTLNSEKLSAMKEGGINRISIGGPVF